LADPFFVSRTDVVQTSVTQAEFGRGTPFAEVLQSIGVLSPVSTGDTDKVPSASGERESTRGTAAGDGAGIGESRAPVNAADARASYASFRGVFGRDIFSAAASALDPMAAGPVDASYRLGFGDWLQFILTGDVELAYQVEVRRDGSVLIPTLGQVPIAGLTLEAARTALRRRAAQSYSGINNGSTHLDVSVSKIRANAVFVIGEVQRPGAYVVSSLSTVFHAIARAGGPSERGSFRNIEVRRGGQLVKQLDLYDYLLDGDADSDIRTEQGDVIYVPLNRRAVSVVGAVRRPATFELRPSEGFGELIRFTGGLLPTAALDRVQIDRVLPPEQRTPGKERVLIDVKIEGKLDSLAAVPLYDSDGVTVFFVGELRRNTVTVRGQVLQPGTYEITPDMVLGRLINSAQGLLPWALTDRIKVLRPIPATGRNELISIDLADPQSWDFRLREFDDVTVLDARVAHPAETIQISGSVFRAGSMMHSERQTPKDAIDLAGGLRPEAIAVEVSRRRVGRNYSDTTSVVTAFLVDSARGLPASALEFVLERDDRVFVRAAPGWRAQRFADLSGMFSMPGVYPIIDGRERISDMLARAGGLLPEAYPGSFRLLRAGRPIAVKLELALRGDPAHDIALMDGDRLSVGANPSTVFVTGEVERSVLVRYERGRRLGDYITLAGGAKPTGDVARAMVESASGGIERGKRRLFIFRHTPEITTGAQIIVPQKPARNTSVGSVLATSVQYATLLASLAVSYVAVSRR
jgi:protein involved in polysaccharide export with SLBB domain